MTNQPPLNPDALENAYAKYAELTVEEWRTRPHSAWRERVIEDVNIAVSAYLAVAQPVVNSVEELDKLPLESVVRDKYGYVYLLEDVDDEFKWSRNGLDAHFPSWGIVLPARVLYRPAVES